MSLPSTSMILPCNKPTLAVGKNPLISLEGSPKILSFHCSAKNSL